MITDGLTAKARIRIRKSPSEVFAAFADASAMSRFWFTRRDAGLQEGESVTWFIGSGAEAIPFEVHVHELSHPNKIVISWERDGAHTQVSWSFEASAAGETVLTIEEAGFSGSSDQIVAQALDSTEGFNQVIVAAKALLEHGVELNVVSDHA